MTKRFLFIAGVEGSGTTLLSRILASPPQCASLGGLHVKTPPGADAERMVEAFQDANKRASDRGAALDEYQAASQNWCEAMADLNASPTFAAISTLVFKRSFPFGSPRSKLDPGPRWTPDLWDCLALTPDSRVVAIYRNPCAATYSCLRRGFDSDLRRLAVICAEQLTWLSAQIAAIGPERAIVIGYEDLCDSPAQTLAGLAQFCSLPLHCLSAAAAQERVSAAGDGRYRLELPAGDADWLDGYFNLRRRQWRNLANRHPMGATGAWQQANPALKAKDLPTNHLMP